MNVLVELAIDFRRGCPSISRFVRRSSLGSPRLVRKGGQECEGSAHKTPPIKHVHFSLLNKLMHAHALPKAKDCIVALGCDGEYVEDGPLTREGSGWHSNPSLQRRTLVLLFVMLWVSGPMRRPINSCSSPPDSTPPSEW